MEIAEIGRMMYALRIEKELSQEELCRGICSVATLSRLEVGERRPDILVFNALLQRLGKCADYINILLTLEEFEYFVKRRNIEIALSTKDFGQAEKDLQELEQELLQNGISIQRQDIYRLHAFLYIQKEKNYKKAEEYIYRALLETIPDIDMWKQVSSSLGNTVWLSEMELQLLLLYVYIRERIGVEEEILLESIFGYIRSKITDETAQNKALAQGLYLQAYFYKKQKMWEKCYKCCEAVIEAEVKNGAIAVLYQALELEMECLENGTMAQNGELRKKEYQCLKEVIEEYGDGINFDNFVFFQNSTSQEKGLVDEVIRFSRLREGYSQEELSDGICSPETMSRIETGKNNPTIKKFYAIMDKLGLSMGYYNTEFVVEKYETLQKVNKLNRFNFFRKYDEAEKVLKEIEKEVDIEANKQQIGVYHVIFDYRQGRISLEESMKKTEGLLQLSLKKIDGKYVMPPFLSNIEISLLNQVAVYYWEMGKLDKTIEILKSLYEYLNQSKVNAPERSKKYFLVITNLAALLEEANDLEGAIQYANEALMVCMSYNVGLRLEKNMTTKAYTQERMDNNKCINNYRKAYYLSGLFGDFRNQNKIRQHVLEKWRIRYED